MLLNHEQLPKKGSKQDYTNSNIFNENDFNIKVLNDIERMLCIKECLNDPIWNEIK